MARYDTLLAFLVFALALMKANAFVYLHGTNEQASKSCTRRLRSSSALNVFWFNRKEDKKEGKESSEKDQGMGGVVTVMDSMDNFKKSQRVGKMTETIVQELSTQVIEGVAADGRVRVFVDGKQRPKGVDIDEAFLAETAGRDLSSALTTAMQDAHDKSLEKMEEKMKAFYNELGLPSS